MKIAIQTSEMLTTELFTITTCLLAVPLTVFSAVIVFQSKLLLYFNPVMYDVVRKAILK